MEENIMWYNKEGRVYDCSRCSMPNCSSRNTTDKSNCLLDKHDVITQELSNKVMEAPEKVYLHKKKTGTDFSIWPIDDTDIEYTRTDAFIEKAENFLEMLGYGFTITDNITHKNYDEEQLIADFRNYMEE